MTAHVLIEMIAQLTIYAAIGLWITTIYVLIEEKIKKPKKPH